METLATRIRTIRKDKGLSMEAFGEKIGISKQSVSKIENGERNPAETTIRTICSKFGVDYYWLTTGEGEPYIDDMDALIDEIAIEKGYDEETVKMLKKLFSLPPESFEFVMDLLRKLKDE